MVYYHTRPDRFARTSTIRASSRPETSVLSAMLNRAGNANSADDDSDHAFAVTSAVPLARCSC